MAGFVTVADVIFSHDGRKFRNVDAATDAAIPQVFFLSRSEVAVAAVEVEVEVWPSVRDLFKPVHHRSVSHLGLHYGCKL